MAICKGVTCRLLKVTAGLGLFFLVLMLLFSFLFGIVPNV